MGVKNEGYGMDRASHVPVEESFMIDVAGQMKKDKKDGKKVEQVILGLFITTLAIHCSTD